MKNQLENKIQELSNEATNLVEQREKLMQTIGQIDIRLHQLTGAISEFDKLAREDAKPTAATPIKKVSQDKSKGRKDPAVS